MPIARPPRRAPHLYDCDVSDLFAEGAADMLDVARELLLDIDREVPGVATVTADCRPALDVVETASSVEVVVDVAGVPPECLRVILRRSSVLVVGSRPPSSLDAKG